MTTKMKNDGLQKCCACGRKRWSECPHSWYLRWTPPGKKRLQVKIDTYVGKHITARKEAAEIVVEIKTKVYAGTFSEPPASPPTTPLVDAPMTTTRLGELYFAAARNKRTGKPLKQSEHYRWAQLIATSIVRPSNGATTTVGEIPAAAVTSHDIEAFKQVHAEPHTVAIADSRGKRYESLRGGTVSTNRILGRWSAVCAWAVRVGHLDTTPFKRGGVTVVEHYGEQARDRRLDEGELDQLLAIAPENMRDLIEVAVGTACRKGELLALRWYQVRFTTGEIALDAKQTKNGKARVVPMLARVREILERRRIGPDGELFGPMVYVFGNTVGEQLTDIATAWTTVRLRAAGFTGVLRDPKKRRLTPEARLALKTYNLKFHDLRREAGSSFVDDGMDPRAVQTFLDHASLATTTRYLRLSQKALHNEARRVDERRAERTAGKTAGKTSQNSGRTSGTADEGRSRKLQVV